MRITFQSDLEARLSARAAAEGITVEAFIERLVGRELQAEDELEVAALEGLRSGEPITVGPGCWEEKHRRLSERLEKSGSR
jgi:hypothetical protein